MSVRAFGGFDFTEADAVRNDLDRVQIVKGWLQERAYASPILYTPGE